MPFSPFPLLPFLVGVTVGAVVEGAVVEGAADNVGGFVGGLKLMGGFVGGLKLMGGFVGGLKLMGGFVGGLKLMGGFVGGLKLMGGLDVGIGMGVLGGLGVGVGWTIFLLGDTDGDTDGAADGDTEGAADLSDFPALSFLSSLPFFKPRSWRARGEARTPPSIWASVDVRQNPAAIIAATIVEETSFMVMDSADVWVGRTGTKEQRSEK
jgi:hypothetical protein